VNARDERGAATLVELIVASALAVLLVGAVLTAAFSTQQDVSLAGADFAAGRATSEVLATALQSMSDAQPLGACQGPGGLSQDVALSQCNNPVASGPAVEAASTGTVPGGLCWYSYPSTSTGLVAPDLRCLVAYADGTLWSFDWPPQPAATYTSCDPATCFPHTPASGVLPAEPTAASGEATLAGTVSQPARAFQVRDAAGATLSVSTSSSQTVLETVYEVDLTVTEAWGAGRATPYSSAVTYRAVIGSALASQEQSWSAA